MLFENVIHGLKDFVPLAPQCFAVFALAMIAKRQRHKGRVLIYRVLIRAPFENIEHGIQKQIRVHFFNRAQIMVQSTRIS